MSRRFGVVAALVSAFVLAPSVQASPVALQVSAFKHITFKNIPATTYSDAAGVLTMKVDKSSSVLVLPFDAERTITNVKFSWRLNGVVSTKNAEHEKTKKGDDFPLRIGLMVSGPAPTVPFFAPAWIKAVRDSVKLPSDKLIYLVAGTKSAPGTTWESPYASSIGTVALQSSPIAGSDWQAVDYRSEATKITGIWVMADGDNTASSFTTEIRDLELN